jgi:hypothetical protein
MVYTSYTNEDLIKLVELSETSNNLEKELTKRLLQYQEAVRNYNEDLSKIIDLASKEYD